MTKKKIYSIFFCAIFLFLFVSASFAQTVVVDNVCSLKQCVKIQNGVIWTLSPDDQTYLPFFVKAVGYHPSPIGRHPSDWGYSPSDPRSTINNIFDDPDILNRDFNLIQGMNANTVRIWKGDDTTVSCACSNNGRYPNKITQNTLNIAASYGLKVIAGFWVNFLNFDQNNNISSIDGNGNPLSRQDIINNFVIYVNNFKSNRAILFWAIGNENNYQVLNAGVVNKSAFENVFGLTYGDSIFT